MVRPPVGRLGAGVTPASGGARPPRRHPAGGMPDPDRTPGLRVTPRPAATTAAAVRRALRRIVGLDRAESRELLSIAHDQYRKPEFQVRFSWRPGSVAFWDTGRPCTTRCATTATSPACWSGY
jgi:alpha-ketoglutarate-dependent taurine dioxygenase